MTAPVEAPAAPGDATVSPHTPTVGSLLRAELLRIRSRRFARWAVVALLVVMVVVLVITFYESAKPTAASVAAARSVCENGGADPSSCATLADLSNQGAFAGKTPALVADLPAGVIGVGTAIAVIGFVFGCTLGGADWSNRTMPALLFWEPRRVRLFAVKLLAFAIALVILMVVAVVLWSLLYLPLIALHGTWHDGATGVARDFGENLVRVAVLDVCLGLVGFGLANLVRNTGAALGVAFVYFAIVDTFVRLLLWRLAPWLLTSNVGALLSKGGLTVVTIHGTAAHVSVFRGGLVLVLYAVLVCGAAAELFRRRDVT